MKTIKTKLITALLSASLVLPGALVATTQAYAAGVPVFDASAFARQLQQLQQAHKQLQQAKAQYEQFRGDRDIGKLFNQYGKYMPAEMQAMYRDYQNGNWQGLADKVVQLEKSQKLTGSQKQMLEKMANDQRLATFQNKVKLDDMYAKSTARFNQIQRMANSIDLQRDPKAAADLLNRIQVESAMLQLQTNQLQMINMMRQAEKDMQREQRIQHARRFNETSADKQRLKF